MDSGAQGMSRSFSEMTQKENNALVVDALNLAFRWKHQGRTDFRYEFEKTVESLAHSYKCDKIIICADHGSSSYRKAIFPEYKADRKERFKDQTEQEKIAFEEFFEEYTETLNLLSEKYPVLRFEGVEADDIAAFIVNCKREGVFPVDHIWLISSDRDWDLMIEEGVSRFSTVTRKEITLENWHEHYDVPAEQYLCYKCLMGDKGDNIPGITGIGPKRATQLLEQYDSIFDIYDAIPIDSKYKHIQNLNENADQLLLNAELMDLPTYCVEAIGIENTTIIESILTELK